MASTSPYQNNDYQAASTYRPYQLPINDIFKAISAQNQFWDDGARRVKNVYENALGLELSLQPNKELRDQFMKDADAKLTKLSSMDLSDPSVQRQGANIYKPLFDDEGIMSDHQATTYIKSVQNDIQRARTTENGKYYNESNARYALDGANEFVNSMDRNAGKGYLQKKKAYLPFHDVSTEYLNVLSKCKANSEKGNSVQGLYFSNTENKSLDASKLNGCLQAGLSDKAWTQLKIDGYVRFKGREGELGQAYGDMVLQNNKSYASDILKADAELKALRDSKKLTPEIEKTYTDYIANRKTEIGKNEADVNKIKSGDLSDVINNYETIAQLVHGHQSTGSFAQSFGYRDVSKTYTSNAAGIAQYNQMNQNARLTTELNFQNQWKTLEYGQKQAELGLKEREADIKLIDALTKNADGSGVDMSSSPIVQDAYRRLDIDLGANTPFTLTKPEDALETGETVNSIDDKIKAYHQNRLNTGEGMYHELLSIVGPAGKEELNKHVTTGNKIHTESMLEYSENYLDDYKKKNPDKPLPSQLQKLEAIVNDYKLNRSNVWSFVKLKDDINKEIATNPELKKKYDNFQKSANEVIDNMGDKTVIFFERGTKKQVVFDKNTMKSLLDDTNPTYRLEGTNDFGVPQLVNKTTGEVLDSGDDGPITTIGGNLSAMFGTKNIYSSTGKMRPGKDKFGAWSPELLTISELKEQYKKDISPKVGPLIQKVARSEKIWETENTPGVRGTIKNNIVGMVPEYNGPDYEFHSLGSRKDRDGTPVTKVQVLKVTKEEGNRVTTDVTNKVISKINSASGTTGGAFSNVRVDKGNNTLKVVTPNLPFFANESPAANGIRNEMIGVNKIPLANRESRNLDFNIRINGYKLGIKAIGGGPGNPKTYNLSLINPDGTEKLIGQETADEENIINQFEVLRQSGLRQENLK